MKKPKNPKVVLLEGDRNDALSYIKSLDKFNVTTVLLITDDNEVLSLAAEDGLVEKMQDALQKPTGMETTFFVTSKLRIFTVFTKPGDSGFLCKQFFDQIKYEKEAEGIKNKYSRAWQ